MATRNTITDEYVLKPTVDQSQAGPALDSLTAKLNAASAAADNVNKTIGGASGQITQATSQFDRYAKKYDDVTRASLALAAAQRQLENAQVSGQRALSLGTTTQQAYDATIAGLAQKVAALAAALGSARAEAEANAEAMARWNGEVSQGAGAAAAMADRIASLAENARGATLRINEWQEATSAAAASQEAFNAVLGFTSAQGQADQMQARAADIEAYGAALDATRARFNPLFAASKQYEQEINDLSAALSSGAIPTTQEYDAALDLLNAKFTAAVDPMSTFAAQQAKVDQVTRASFAALDQYSAAMDGLRAKYDPVFAASKQYETALNEIAEAEQAAGAGATAWGDAARTTAATKLAGASQATNGFASSNGNAAFALRQAQVQMVQFGSSVASGSPILLAAIQQGHQLADVAFATGTGFGTLGAAVADAWNKIAGVIASHPIVAAIAAVTAAVVALSASAEINNRAWEATSNQLSATRDDFDAMAAAVRITAKDISASTGTARTDAATMAQAFAAVPGIAGPALSGLSTIAIGLSKVMGTDLAASTKTVIEALNDPLKSATTLAAANFRLMDAATLATVQHLVQMGDRVGASNIVLTAMGAAAKTANDNVSPLTQAWHNFTEALNAPGSGNAKGFFQELGESINGALADAINALARIVGFIQSLRDQVKANPGLIPEGATAEQTLGTQPTAESLQSQITTAQQGMADAQKAGMGAAVKQFQDQIAGLQQQLAQLQTNPLLAPGKQPPPPGQLSNVGGLAGNLLPDDAAQQAALAKTGVADFGNFSTQAKTVADLTKELVALQAARDAIAKQPTLSPTDAAMVAGYGAAIEQVKINLQNAEDPTRLQTQQLLNSAAAAGVVGEADRKLLQTQQDLQLQQSQNAAFPISAAQAAARLAAVTAELAAGQTLLQNQLTLTASQQDVVTAAWEKGTASGLAAQIRVDAFNETLKHLSQNAPGFSQAVDDLAAKMTKVAQSGGIETMTKLTTASNEQAAATLRVAHAWDGSQASLDHLQNLEKAQADALANHLTPGSDDYTKSVQNLTKALDAGSDALRVMAQETASVSAVSSAFSSAFSTVGNAISQAFVQGQGAAVNWGNVTRAVIAQVIQKIAELAILNPILNNLFGQNNGTLGTAIQVLTQAGGTVTLPAGTTSSGSGLNLSSVVSGVGTASSASGAFGGPTIGSALGLTGPDGLLTGLGSSVGGIFSTGASASTVALSNAPLAAGFAGPVATGGVGEGAGLIGGLQNSIVAGLNTNIGIGSATIGGAISGVGLGFGAGSLAGGLIQGGLNKTGPAPEIGAAGGAVAGAIIGSVIPVIGTVIGGLIGGLIGGAGGGFIGPHVANPFLVGNITTQGGQLGLQNILSQKEDDQAIKFIQETRAEIAQINALLSANKATVNATGLAPTRFEAADTAFNIGNSPNGNLTPTLDAGFSALRFSSTDADTNSALQDRSFVDPTALQNFFTAQTSFKAFITSVSDLTKNLGVTTGSYNDSLKQLNDAYVADKASADAIIATGNLSADQTARLVAAEGSLADVRDKSVKELQDAINRQLDATAQGFQSRFLNAAAQISGSSADAQTAALYAFNIGATQQRQQLADAMKAIFGDSFASTQQFANESAGLESTLGEERLAIITAANKQIVAQTQQNAAATLQAATQGSQAAASLIASLRTFVTGLAQGAQSPLSPESKLQAAQAAFSTAATGARAGDANSLGQVQTTAGALLTAAQAFFGSSGGYVSVFNEVTAAIKDIAGTSPDTLTASFMAQQLQTQTDALVQQLVLLRQALGVAGPAPAGSAQGTNAAFVTGLYQSVLGRAPDAGGLASWSGALNAGTETPAQAMSSFQNSPEAVARLYQTELGRAPDAAGLANWLQALAGGMTFAQIKAAFDASPEFVSKHADGGWIGNGVWNKDSVRAGLAGGGNVMLAGGEYVVSATAAARYADVLPKINAQAYGRGGANDNSAGIIAELRALRLQAGTASVMEVRAQTSEFVAAIAGLRTEVAALRADANRRANRPARLTG